MWSRRLVGWQDGRRRPNGAEQDALRSERNGPTNRRPHIARPPLSVGGCDGDLPRADAEEVFLPADEEAVRNRDRGCDDSLAHVVFGKDFECTVELRDEDDA